MGGSGGTPVLALDAQWAAIEPHMPKNQLSPEREDDRRIIFSILHVLTSGCRWQDCPSAYGLSDVARAGWSGEAAAIDSTYVKAHCLAQGEKGAKVPERLPSRDFSLFFRRKNDLESQP